MSSHSSSLSSQLNRVAAMLAGFSLFAGMALSASQARADDLIVKFDQSQLLRLPRPAAEIIIGNPSVADVAIQTGNLLVVTGKSFGITNIIALDAERNVIQDQRILVRRDDNKVVNVYRSSERASFNCTPQCNPQLMIGDDVKHFTKTKTTADAKQNFSERAIDNSTQSGGNQ